MRSLKPISAVALGALCVPAAHALQISDETVKLNVGVRLQSRVQIADATSNDGDEYNVQNGAEGKNDPADFSLRRARLMFNGSYGSDWKFNMTLQADGVDRSGTASASRTAALRYGWIERSFKLENDMAHVVKFG